MAIKLTELDPSEDPDDLTEARLLNRAGHTIARVVGEFDWDPDLHPRHEKGSEFGGRFRKGPSKRGALRERSLPSLSSLQLGNALGRETPGGVARVNAPAGHGVARVINAPAGHAPEPLPRPESRQLPWRDESGALMRPTDLPPSGMWSPPGGWTSTDEADHPTYPKGYPKKAGKPIRVGDVFNYEGHDWEVAHIVHGHLIIEEASGKKGKAETRIIDPQQHPGSGTEIAGLSPSKPKKIIGGQSADASTVRVVDAHVDEASHDPSLKLPATSEMSDEEWKRFGKAEQLHYIDLMERFGSWKDKAPIQQMVNSILNEYDSEIVNLVKGGHQTQYGSSTGSSLSIAGLPATLAGQEKRSKALDLQGRLRDVVAWDIYNRVRAPDLMVFHGSHHGVSWWKNLLKKSTTFSGLSTAFNIYGSHPGAGKGGWNKVGFPLSIRHICFSTTVNNWTGSHFKKEYEIAALPKLKIDNDRAVFFDYQSIGAMGQKWLDNITEDMRPGPVLETLRAHLDKGEPLPVTVSAGLDFPDSGKLPPNPAALEALEEYGGELPQIHQGQTAKALAEKKLPWKYTDENGVPQLKSGEEASVKPGDFIMGKQGTLYWLDDDLTIHMIVSDGKGKLKFNGETYPWNGQHENYNLLGNVPPLKPEIPDPFEPGAWQYAAEEKMPISQMPVGTKFKVQGVAYEKVGDGNLDKTPIKDLEKGTQGTINSQFQTVRLVPSDGYHGATTLKPEKGMTLSYEGKKHKITNVKKDGTVSIKPAGAGKVVTIAGDDPALDDLFNPDDWSIGEKTALSNLQVGDLFHGGTGSQTIKPYKVIGIEGKKVQWQNMDTGEKNYSLGLKQVKQLDPSDGSAPDAEHKGGLSLQDQIKAEGSASKTKAEVEKTAEKVASQPQEGAVWGITPDMVGSQVKVSGGIFDVITDLDGKVKLKKDGNTFWLDDWGETAKYELVKPGAESPKSFADLPVGSTYKATEASPTLYTKTGPTSAEGGGGVIDVNPGFEPHEVVTVAEPEPAAPIVADDIENLPEPPSFAPYASVWGSGAKYKHDKVMEMPVGTVFQDKNKKLWKVQVSGALSVITDGTDNFKIDGDLRGRKVEKSLPSPPAPLTTNPYAPEPEDNGWPKLDPVAVLEPLLGETEPHKNLTDLLKMGEPANYLLHGQMFHWDGERRLWVHDDGTTEPLTVDDKWIEQIQGKPTFQSWNAMPEKFQSLAEPKAENWADLGAKKTENGNNATVADLPDGVIYWGDGYPMLRKDGESLLLDENFDLTGGTIAPTVSYAAPGFVPSHVAVPDGAEMPIPTPYETDLLSTLPLHAKFKAGGHTYTVAEITDNFSMTIENEKGEQETLSVWGKTVADVEKAFAAPTPVEPPSISEPSPVATVPQSKWTVDTPNFTLAGDNWEVVANGTLQTFVKGDNHGVVALNHDEANEAGLLAKIGKDGETVAEPPEWGVTWKSDQPLQDLGTEPLKFKDEKGGEWELVAAGQQVYLKDPQGQLKSGSPSQTLADLDPALKSDTVAVPPAGAPKMDKATDGTDAVTDLYEADDEFEVEGVPYKLVTKMGTGGAVVQKMESGELIPLAPGGTLNDLAHWKGPVMPQPEPDLMQDILAGVPHGLLDKVQKLSPSELAALPEPEWGYYGSVFGAGAKYKHWRLDELSPGMHFKPKGEPKGDYIMVKSLAGGKVLIYKPQDNSFMVAPGEGRIRLINE